MESSKEKRILVCGSISDLSDVEKVFTRMENLLKKGKWDFLFVAGSFVDDISKLEPFIKGEKKVPLLTYFCHEKMDPAMVCENLICLGSFGVLSIEGLRVGFLWDEGFSSVLVQSGK